MVLYLRAIDKIALNVRLKCQGVSLRLKPFRCSSVVGIVWRGLGSPPDARAPRGRRGERAGRGRIRGSPHSDAPASHSPVTEKRNHFKNRNMQT